MFNYATETLNTKKVQENLDQVFIKLNYEFEMNLAIGFYLKTLPEAKFRVVYVREKTVRCSIN